MCNIKAVILVVASKEISLVISSAYFLVKE